MIPLPPKRDKNKYPCPVCKQTACYKHCNNCGANIFFKKNDWDKWSCYEELTGTLHRCMGGGTKSGKYLHVNQDPDVDKVDERTKEIAVKRWKAIVGYKPLNKYEKEHLEFSKKYYNDFYVNKKERNI